MNYFELFNLAVDFVIDKKLLERQYNNLITKNHPDNFANLNPLENAMWTKKSALINDGYKILANDLSRAKHIVTLKNGQLDKKVEPAFLMQQMALEEQLEQSNSKDKLQQLQQQLVIAIKDTYAQFAKMLQVEDIEKLEVLLSKVSYLEKFKQRLKTTLHNANNN